MVLVDSHCHLNSCASDEGDLTLLIGAAKNNNVGYMLTVATCVQEVTALKKIAAQYENIYFSYGIHPSDEEILKMQDDFFNTPEDEKLIAIGETGFDFFHSENDARSQWVAFEKHVILANKLNLPLIIHTRAAKKETLEFLTRHVNKKRGVIHCFTEDIEFARKMLDLGFYLSFSGIATFKNSMDLRSVIRYAPLDRILIETDSPYLAPAPYRGKKNQPAWVSEVARVVANTKEISFEDVANTTTTNFFTLFDKAAR